MLVQCNCFLHGLNDCHVLIKYLESLELWFRCQFYSLLIVCDSSVSVIKRLCIAKG